MKIKYPIIKSGSGGNVYFERLSDSLNNYKTNIQYYPHFFEIFPSPLKIIPYYSEKYDLIHTNAEYGYAFKRKKIPLLITFHHSVFSKKHLEYSSINQKIYYKLLYKYIKKSLKVSDCNIAVSKNTKKEIEKTFNVKNIKIIYNGIDTKKFRPKKVKKNIFSNKIKLFFVGNLIKRKGSDLLPKIMKKLDDRFILFYTSGLRTKKQFKNKKMILIGKVSQKKLIDYYNLSDIVLVPSRVEGFGYSAAEGMSCGKPVVATNSSSLPELVEDGKGGFLCEMNNVDDFVEKIQKLAEDKKLRKKMGKFNRKKVIKKFNLKKMGNEYEKLYKKYV